MHAESGVVTGPLPASAPHLVKSNCLLASLDSSVGFSFAMLLMRWTWGGKPTVAPKKVFITSRVGMFDLTRTAAVLKESIFTSKVVGIMVLVRFSTAKAPRVHIQACAYLRLLHLNL